MFPGRSGCELAVLAVLGVLTIFLFPAMQGSYSAMHGPATALQAARAAAKLRAAIVQCARTSLSSCLISPIVFLSWMSFQDAGPRAATLAQSNAVLRC
jgi:hypothetical protein